VGELMWTTDLRPTNALRDKVVDRRNDEKLKLKPRQSSSLLPLPLG
jgi:hypothetical protein